MVIVSVPSNLMAVYLVTNSAPKCPVATSLYSGSLALD